MLEKIKSRVIYIMNYKKNVFFVGIAVVIVIAGVVLIKNPIKTVEVFLGTRATDTVNLEVTNTKVSNKKATNAEEVTNTEAKNTETANTETENPENANLKIAVTETLKTVDKLPLLVQPFQLSQAKFTLNNRPMTLNLIMTKGTHVTNGEIGPYGTDYYEGNLIGELYDSQNKLVSSTDMNKYFTESIIFRNKFKLLFDDYNGDGLTDFTVGQYASSNYNVFNIFTIKSNAEIALLPVENQPDGVTCSKYDEFYSTKFI